MSLCFEQIRNQEYRLNHVREMKKRKSFSFLLLNYYFLFSKKIDEMTQTEIIIFQGGSCNIGPDVGGSVEK
jgi:hypothetical protein